jgi:hypothetical protein
VALFGHALGLGRHLKPLEHPVLTLAGTGEVRCQALTVVQGLRVMSTPSISGTQSPSVTGLVAGHYHHYKKEPGQAPSLPAVSTNTTTSEPLASAIAAALTQLGLTPNANAAGVDSSTTTSGASSASLPQQQKVSSQIQQYKNMASTSSGLAQALNASTSSTSSTSSGTGSLTSVFQNLWSSLGSSSETATDASGSTMPSLQSFLKTLASNLSESGITGLHGVFVDTVA